MNIIIALTRVFNAAGYTLYTIVRSLTAKKESHCSGCSGCSLRQLPLKDNSIGKDISVLRTQ